MATVKHHNQDFYDAAAVKYDARQYADEMSTKSADAILGAYKAVNQNHQEARALDFGIGTGLVAVKLVPFLQSILGIDISEEMLNQVQKKRQDPKYSAAACKIETVRHLVTMDDPFPVLYPNRSRDLVSAGGQGFDVVFASQVIHHLQQAREAIQTLVHHFVKRETGWFILVDNEFEDGMQEAFHKVAQEVFDVRAPPKGGEGQEADGKSNSSDGKSGKPLEVTDIVPHDTGFRREDLYRWFSEAGLVDVQVKTSHTVEFFIPSENRMASFKFLIAIGRRA